MNKANKKADYPKVFRLRAYWLATLMSWLAMGWYVYAVLEKVIRNPKLWLLALTIPVEVYAFFFTWHLVRDFRLLLEEKGITLILWIRSIYADWSQVKLSKHLYRSQKLSLDNPTVTKRKAHAFLFDILQWRNNRSFNMIPFTKLTWSKFETLEAEIDKLAPHVFSERE